MKKIVYALLGFGIGLLLGNYLLVPYLHHRQLAREMESPPATVDSEETCIQRLKQRATTAKFQAEWGTPMRRVGYNIYHMGSFTTDSLTLEMDVGKINAEKDTIYCDSWTGEPLDKSDTVFSVVGLSPEMREALVAKAKHDLYCRWLEAGKAACIRLAQRDSIDAVVRRYGGRYQPAPDECAGQPEECR